MHMKKKSTSPKSSSFIAGETNGTNLIGNREEKLSKSLDQLIDQSELTRINIIDRCEGVFFQNIKNKIERFYVTVGFDNLLVWTVKVSPHDSDAITKKPMVFIHGLCGGSALWSKMMDLASSNRVCYFIDMPGFGKSSRVEFGNDTSIDIIAMVDLIDQWRLEVELDCPFDIFSHSFGAFISSCYTLRHKKFVKNLILLDPWGISAPFRDWEKTSEYKSENGLAPVFLKGLSLGFKIVNPLTLMRAGGIAGKYILSKVRDDIYEGFDDFVPKNIFYDYIYYCNSAEPTGEKFYSSCQKALYFSKYPISSYAHKFSKELKIFILSAENSPDYVVNKKIGDQLSSIMGSERVEHKVYKDQTHHLYNNNGFIEEIKEFFTESL